MVIKSYRRFPRIKPTRNETTFRLEWGEICGGVGQRSPWPLYWLRWCPCCTSRRTQCRRSIPPLLCGCTRPGISLRRAHLCSCLGKQRDGRTETEKKSLLSFVLSRWSVKTLPLSTEHGCLGKCVCADLCWVRLGRRFISTARLL